MRKILMLGFLLYAGLMLHSQPHLEGELRISMKQGLMEARLTVSGLPSLGDYRILLNKGMNVEYFRLDSNRATLYSGFYDGRMRGESIEYLLLKNWEDTIKNLPSSFSIKYRGAFPVYLDTLNVFDFKGFIAFNGKTLRATEQSKWYPVIYDVSNDKLLEDYSYSIRVISDDARTVFINGSIPAEPGTTPFVSKKARPLFLFAGDYSFVHSGGNYILNADVDENTSAALFRELDKIRQFHASRLGLTYDENIYLVSHKAVEPFRAGRSWGFTAFPSFAYAGVDFRRLLDSTGRLSPQMLAFFAHELSHYYFDSRLASGPLQWFWLESTTEYLAYKSTQVFTDTAYSNSRVRGYIRKVRQSDFPPLADINQPGQINDDYRYMYGPLIWLCFEKQFGEAVTYRVLKTLVESGARKIWLLADWKEAALAAGVKATEWDQFHNRYLKGANAKNQVTQACDRSY